MFIFFQDQSRVWTAASQQYKVDNQPLATYHKAVVSFHFITNISPRKLIYTANAQM